MKKWMLNENWQLKEAPLSFGREKLFQIRQEEQGWMVCSLPADVHQPLEQAGRIGNVIEADHCRSAEWIAERSWWFQRELWVTEKQLRYECVELTLGSLDGAADIFVNESWLGSHRNAFVPFCRDIREALRPGKNLLTVRLTVGMEAFSEKDIADMEWACRHEREFGCPERGDMRRMFVRKPQYCVGWDWAPKILTCGIVGEAWLTLADRTIVRSAHVWTERLDGTDAHMRLSLCIDQLHPYATRPADISVSLLYEGKKCACWERQDVLLCAGRNEFDGEFLLPNARLWWPNGYGDQPLYQVRVRVNCEGETCENEPFEVGVRVLEWNQEKINKERRRFELRLNGQPVFCKGANWVPAHSVYAKITRTEREEWIALARNAGFTMLRIWGGGIYEPDDFYRACDRAGILVWQDFMFACSLYPDHLDWFRRTVEEELEAQILRLRNHPSLALFCGNNEIEMGYNTEESPLHLSFTRQRPYGMQIFHELAPKWVHWLSPEIPYWCSSPYGGALPNEEGLGDVHYWDGWGTPEETEKRLTLSGYDQWHASFVSEFGFQGPCVWSSVKEYLQDADPQDRSSALWRMHTNTCEHRVIDRGLLRLYGREPEKLTAEEWVLYGGMLQAEVLQYALEALRVQGSCGGALFWMYNDAWGETGWSVVDVYRRPKLSYYAVRRAFAPRRLILREKDGLVCLYGCNDGPEPVSFAAWAGYLSFDGRERKMEKRAFWLEAHSRKMLGQWPLPQEDDRRGIFAVLPEDGAMESCRLYRRPWKECLLPQPQISVKYRRAEQGWQHCLLRSETFVPCVCAAVDGLCGDNAFDLYPGVEKLVRLPDTACPTEWRCLTGKAAVVVE